MVDKAVGCLRTLGSRYIFVSSCDMNLLRIKGKKLPLCSSFNLFLETVAEDEVFYFFGEKIKLKELENKIN